MTSLLSLAADYLDQLSSVRFSREQHEEAGERLAALLRDDSSLDRFAQEIGALSDPDELSPDGWLWVLDFASTQQRVRLNPNLLRELCLRWTSPSLIALAVEAGLDQIEGELSEFDSLDDIGNPWLLALIDEVRDVTTHDPDGLRRLDPSDADDDPAGGRPLRSHSDQSEPLFLAFLIIESPMTLSLARAMMDAPEFRDRLNTLVDARLDLLEDDARASWNEMLRRTT